MKYSISILGCGWLGEPLASSLINDGFQVKGSTTSPEKLVKFQSLGISPFIISIDYCSENILEFLNSEVLIISIPSKNIVGFSNIISHIERSAVKNVIFISSTSVYPNSENIITEDHKTLLSPLFEIEEQFRNNSNFLTTILRFGGLFGYDRHPGNFFPIGKVIDNPDGKVNMIHLDDCISIIMKIIKNNVWNETLNACSDSHPTRREFYTKCAIDLGRSAPVFNENVTVQSKIVSNKKLKQLLKFNFKYPNPLKSL